MRQLVDVGVGIAGYGGASLERTHGILENADRDGARAAGGKVVGGLEPLSEVGGLCVVLGVANVIRTQLLAIIAQIVVVHEILVFFLRCLRWEQRARDGWTGPVWIRDGAGTRACRVCEISRNRSLRLIAELGERGCRGRWPVSLVPAPNNPVCGHQSHLRRNRQR